MIKDVKEHNPLTDIFHKCVMVFGLAESALSKEIESWEDSLPEDMHLAYLPNPLTGVRLRLSIYGGDKDEEERRIDEQFARLSRFWETRYIPTMMTRWRTPLEPCSVAQG